MASVRFLLDGFAPRPHQPAPGHGVSALATGNSAAAVPTSTLLGDRFEAYDRLPPSIRDALQQAVTDWCPMTIQLRFTPIAQLVPDTEDAARLYVGCFHSAEAEEIGLHSQRYRIRYNWPAPHVAAEASVLRSSGPPPPRRRHPRRG